MQVTIEMFRKYVQYTVRNEKGELVASGSDPLVSTNGDYDSLLSNVINHASSLCHDVPHFILRKC